MSDLCTLEIDEVERRPVIRVKGEIDLSNAAEMEAELRELLGTPYPVLDLNGLEYIDSAGLAALERLLRGTGSPLVVAPDATIRRTLAIAAFHLDSRIHPDLESALESAGGGTNR